MAQWLFEIFGTFQYSPGEKLSSNDKACFVCQNVGNIEKVEFTGCFGCSYDEMKVTADGVEFSISSKLAWSLMTGGLHINEYESKALIDAMPDTLAIDVCADGTDICDITMEEIRGYFDEWPRPQYYVSDPRLMMMACYIIMPEVWVKEHQVHIPEMAEAVEFLKKYGVYQPHFNIDYDASACKDPYGQLALMEKDLGGHNWKNCLPPQGK